MHKAGGAAVPGARRARGPAWLSDVPELTALPEGEDAGELASVLEFVQASRGLGLAWLFGFRGQRDQGPAIVSAVCRAIQPCWQLAAEGCCPILLALPNPPCPYPHPTHARCLRRR